MRCLQQAWIRCLVQLVSDYLPFARRTFVVVVNFVVLEYEAPPVQAVVATLLLVLGHRLKMARKIGLQRVDSRLKAPNSPRVQ
jgi:hypothetical protein